MGVNKTALDLLRLTLLSIYIILANACWLPFLSRIPYQVLLFLQFFLIVIPQSMIVVYPEHSNKQYFFFTLIGLVGALFTYLRYKLIISNTITKQDLDSRGPEKAHILDKVFSSKTSKKSNSISCYQTCIMIMTVTAISAADFSAFPSHFRKTKQFGLSLMDIGVALIISASGLVMGKYLHSSSKLGFRKLVKMTWPTFTFGVVRGILGQYNIGADEYGRHWSFFLNLSFVPYSLLLWNSLPSPHFIPIVCLVVMAGYQFLLSKRSYAVYIFTKDASSFFSSNKIGIFSLIGYLCLFSVSCYFGRVFQNRHSNFKQTIACLGCSCFVFWSFFLCTSEILPPSRTLANFNYVIWALGNGSLHYVLLTLLDYAVPEKYRFVVLADMVSEYRLSIFLIANILSHLVRLTFTVKSTFKLQLGLIISSYMFATLLAVSLHYTKAINFGIKSF